MAVAFDAVGPSASGTTSATSPLTWTHVCGASATHLLVGATWDGSPDSGQSMSATYNGVSMTSLGVWHCGSGTAGFLQVWALASPATGSHSVSVTATGSPGGLNGGSVSFTGSTALSAVQTFVPSGNVTNPSLAFTGSISGNMVAAFVGGGSPQTPSGSFTSRYNENAGSGQQGAGYTACSTIASPGGSTTASWTANSDFYAVAAVEVQASAPPPSFARDTETVATAFTSTGTQTTSHAGSANARAAVVLIDQNGTTADEVSGVTYGGAAMTRLRSDTESTEAGRVYIYWLDGVATGTQNVAMTTTAATNKQLVVATMTASAGASVAVAGHNTGTSASVANPSWTITGLTAASDLEAYEVIHSGLTTMTTTPAASWTLISSTDLGAQGRGFARQSVASSGTSLACGWTAATADDFVGSSVAFTEVAVVTGAASLAGAGAVAATAVFTASGTATIAAAATVTATAAPPVIAGLGGSGAGYFADQYGNPRFVLGDAVWGLPGNAGRWSSGAWQSDFDTYTATRAGQGFTVIYTKPMGTTQNAGINDDGRTFDGLFPFQGGSLANPSTGLTSAYWARIDYFLNSALAQGLTVFMNAIGYDSDFETSGPLAGKSSTEFGAYGTALGARYASQVNLVWVVADDYFGGSTDTKISAFLTALRAAGDTHPITIENFPETTSRQDTSTGGATAWGASNAQYNWCYSYNVTYYGVEKAFLESSPITPIQGDGYFYQGGSSYAGGSGSFAFDRAIRQDAWHAISSGARGIIHGDEACWQWASTAQASAAAAWYHQHNAGNIRALMESLPNWHLLIPDTSSQLVTAGRGTHATGFTSGGGGGQYEVAFTDSYVSASRTAAGDLAVIYLSHATSITIDQSKMVGSYQAFWADPITGAKTSTTAGSTYNSATPGNNSQGDPDWVLILQAPGSGATASAGVATASGTAPAPAVAVTVSAGVAAAAGAVTAPRAAVSLSAAAAAGQATAPAPQPAVTPGAAVAAASAVSLAPKAAAGISAGPAAGTGIALAPVPAAGVISGVAPASAIALAATVTTSGSANAPAGVAAAAGVASQATAAVTVAAGVAAGSGIAPQPSVVTGGTTNAPAGVAAATGAAPSPVAAAAVPAGASAAAGIAPAATGQAARLASAGAAAAAGAAPAPALTLATFAHATAAAALAAAMQAGGTGNVAAVQATSTPLVSAGRTSAPIVTGRPAGASVTSKATSSPAVSDG